MPTTTVPTSAAAPTSRPPRRHHQPSLGVSTSYDIGDQVTVTTDGDWATIQLGTGASLCLTGRRDEVTTVIVEAYRQLLGLPHGLPQVPGR